MNEWLKATMLLNFPTTVKKKSDFLTATLTDDLPLSLWALGTRAQPPAVAVLQHDSFLVGQPTVTASHACSSVQCAPECPEKGHLSWEALPNTPGWTPSLCAHNKDSDALIVLYYNHLFSRVSSGWAGTPSFSLALPMVPVVLSTCSCT